MYYSYIDDYNEKHIIFVREQWEIDFLKSRFEYVRREEYVG